MSKILNELRKDEGLRLKAYQDHLGVWTIGYGTNLQVLEITEATAEKWLRAELDAIREQADKLPLYAGLDSTRKNVILSMMYQMGVDGTLAFKNMWRAIEEGDFEQAGEEMIDSKWYTQTPGRASRMAERMTTGVW